MHYIMECISFSFIEVNVFDLASSMKIKLFLAVKNLSTAHSIDVVGVRTQRCRIRNCSEIRPDPLVFGARKIMENREKWLPSAWLLAAPVLTLKQGNANEIHPTRKRVY